MNFDYGNLLTRTLQISWKHKAFSGILTLPILVSFAVFPVMFLFLFLFEDGKSQETNALITLGFIAFSILITIITMVLQIYAISAVSLGIVRVEKDEGSLKFMDLLQDGRQYFGRQLGVFLIIQLSIGLIFAVFFGFVFVATIVTVGMASICLQPIMILLTPLMFLMFAVLEGAHIAVITENLSAWDAIKRSIEIVRQHIWKYIILTVIIYFGVTIFTSLAIFPVTFPFVFLAIFSESVNEIGRTPFLLMIIGSFCIFFPLMALVSGISQTLMKVSLGLTYLRLTRKDENQVIVSET
ncbi:MAG: hypothetical protein UZ14_CFX002000540 [Chloroflexi bacterium OLB14]|nr:MAG: hypothetical protein UZ14_CFX002000540 [Chloroflexi bacterium OLB14]